MKNKLISKIVVISLIATMSLSLVSCKSKDKDKAKETDGTKTEETVAKGAEDEISVLLDNPDGVVFDEIRMSYGKSSVSPPPDGRAVYEFIKTVPKTEETYTIIGKQEGEEVVKFEFKFNEATKENPKLVLKKVQNNKLQITIEDENTKKLITGK